VELVELVVLPVVTGGLPGVAGTIAGGGGGGGS